MFSLNNTLSSEIRFNSFEKFGLTFFDPEICSITSKGQIKYIFNRFLSIATCYSKGEITGNLHLFVKESTFNSSLSSTALLQSLVWVSLWRYMYYKIFSWTQLITFQNFVKISLLEGLVFIKSATLLLFPCLLQHYAYIICAKPSEEMSTNLY